MPAKGPATALARSIEHQALGNFGGPVADQMKASLTCPPERLDEHIVAPRSAAIPVSPSDEAFAAGHRPNFPNNWPQSPRLCTNPHASGFPRQAWDWFHHQRC